MKSVMFYTIGNGAEQYLDTFPLDVQPSVGDYVSIRITVGKYAGVVVNGEVMRRRWELCAHRGGNETVFDATLRVFIATDETSARSKG